MGAGTGLHGKWFADAGLDVLCTDASAAMVEACRAKGLDALQMDFLSLDPAGTFDAVFAMNCLLHVPPDDLHAALCAIHDVLVPGGWFFLGQYGGFERASTWEDDVYEPKRFFSYLSDDALLGAVARAFDVVEFHTVDCRRPRTRCPLPGVHAPTCFRPACFRSASVEVRHPRRSARERSCERVRRAPGSEVRKSPAVARRHGDAYPVYRLENAPIPSSIVTVTAAREPALASFDDELPGAVVPVAQRIGDAHRRRRGSSRCRNRAPRSRRARR